MAIEYEMHCWALEPEPNFERTVTGNHYKYLVSPFDTAIPGYRGITRVNIQKGGSGEDTLATVEVETDGTPVSDNVRAILIGLDGRLFGPFDVASVSQEIEKVTFNCYYALQLDLYLARVLRSLTDPSLPFVDPMLIATMMGTDSFKGMLEYAPYSYWDARLLFPDLASDYESRTMLPLIMATLVDNITYAEYKSTLEKWGIGMLPNVIAAPLIRNDGSVYGMDVFLETIYFPIYPLEDKPVSRLCAFYSLDENNQLHMSRTLDTPELTMDGVYRDEFEWTVPDIWNKLGDFRTREISLSVAPQSRVGRITVSSLLVFVVTLSSLSS